MPVVIFKYMDHDQRCKVLIREFFADFLRLFFAAWAARLDLSRVEWLDKELYHDPPKRVAWLGAEALRRLAEAPLTEQQRFLLGECVEAYLPLDDEQQRQFERLIQSKSYAGVRAMNQTTYERGIEKGIERGRREGQMEFICSLIEDRFGPVPEAIRRDLERLPVEQLRRLALKIATAGSLADLGLSASRGNTAV